MTRVAVIGSAGQLGSELVRVLQAAGGYELIPLTHHDIECVRPESVQEVLSAVRADVVVNCAAIVRVDECEDRPDEALTKDQWLRCIARRACLRRSRSALRVH